MIRSYGLEGIREKLRSHLQLAQLAKRWIEAKPGLEILALVNFNTICFRFAESGISDQKLNGLNESWMNNVNSTGKAFFTHTKLDGKFVIRWVIGQTDVQEKHIRNAWGLLLEKLEETLPQT